MVACAEMFIATLDSRGLNYGTRDLPDGGTLVQVGFFGKTTNFLFGGDDNGTHVGIRTIFDHVPDEKVADLLVICNSLNCQYRWVKFCIDKDNDIMVEDDAWLSPETAGDECFELLIRTVDIMKDVTPTIMRGIYA